MKDIFEPAPDIVARAHVDGATYDAMYARSLEDPEGFWAEQARRLDWIKAPTRIRDVDFTPGRVKIEWFADGQLNVAANCVDRHLETRGEQTAIIFEPDDPEEPARHITYRDLHRAVCRMANVLESLGVRKGDRVVIYLPMIPEAAYAMLACARIGAIHSIVFAGFSPDALSARINGCDAKVLITADEAPRGGRKYLAQVQRRQGALLHAKDSVKCLVVKRTGGQTTWVDGRDFDYNEMAAEAYDFSQPAAMNAEDPLFILYTSGSTGQPKGVVHTSGGYLVYAGLTHQITFDYHDGDVYWCTADVGWVTGPQLHRLRPAGQWRHHADVRGRAHLPRCRRFWQVCEKHEVTQFYTAPTAIRALMGQGDDFVTKCDLSSCAILGTVGEPINPEAWIWYNERGGRRALPIVDTWWQTETGGHLLTPCPARMRQSRARR